MNLQALYDLKERLEYAAIAGTGLLSEDFRLKRAVNTLAPLAAASPVFAKIAASVRALLAAPAEKRSEYLLSALGLINAVTYTQGTSDVSGTPEPLTDGSGKYIPISFRQLEPLILALTTSSSGRMSVIEENYREHPEYFSDFRVLPHLVTAIGDNYSEIADLAVKILIQQKADVLELLKENFNPAGKKEMVRRVHLLYHLAGETENDWYIAQLADAKKEVREALILALGCCQDNAQLLLDLSQGERGKAKNAALTALAKMENADCIDCWEKDAAKHISNISLLDGNSSKQAANLIAHTLRAYMTNKKGVFELSASKTENLSVHFRAVSGRYSEEIRDLWLFIADNINKLAPDCDAAERAKLTGDELSGRILQEIIQKCMIETMLSNPCEDVISLARELAARNEKWFMCCRFVADLMEKPAGEVFDAYSRYIPVYGTCKAVRQQHDQFQIMQCLTMIDYDQKAASYRLHSHIWHAPSNADQLPVSVPLTQGVDPRWVDCVLAAQGIEDDSMIYDLSNTHRFEPANYAHILDIILLGLIDPNNAATCDVIGQFLYKRMMSNCQIMFYVDGLKKCGWTRWRGILSTLFNERRFSSFAAIYTYLDRLPLTNSEKADELQAMDFEKDALSRGAGAYRHIMIHNLIERYRSLAQSENQQQ